MSPLPAPLFRGLAIVAIGATLTLSHIAFASAAPQLPGGTPVTGSGVAEVETTSSIASAQELGENCYVDVQAVRSVRGKTVAVRSIECD